MAYTLKQLTMAWTAVHGGVAPDADTVFQLQLRTNASYSDQDALAYVLNSADNSTALAALSYQFFTGKSPTQAGMAFLTNSADNPNDLNDAYYAKFNIENRYINFAANLGVVGEGKDAFAGKYGAMSFAAYVASIYETIIGSSYATAAGLDPAKAIADIVGRQDAILATARAAGMITPNMTQAQIDLAVKAATAGYLMGEAIKADVGLYAAAANNFMLALAKGEAVYNTDLTTTYKPLPGSGSQGTGHAVDTAPPATSLPGLPAPPPPPEPEPGPTPLHFTLTGSANTLAGGDLDDTFTATNATLDAGDTLDGGGGDDTLTLTVTGAYTLPAATVSNIETVTINSDGALIGNISAWTGVETLNVTVVGSATVRAATDVDVTMTASQHTGNLNIQGGHDITVNATGTTTGSVTLGGGAADPTGAIKVNTSSSQGVNQGQINISGGTTVEVTQTASNAVNTTHGNSAVRVNGRAGTTEVTLVAPKTVTAATNVVGNNANTVQIFDFRDGTSNVKGTITKVSIDGATTVSITDNALSDLSLAHTTGNITLNNTNALANPDKTTTLALKVNGVSAGQISDTGVYTQLDITTGAEASSLGTVGMSGLTTVTIAGAGDLTANVSGIAALTSVDASTSTGANTITLDATKATYEGGAGVDNVVLSNTAAITQAIEGGGGTTDQVSVNWASIYATGAAAFAANITGFERLALTDLTNSGDLTINVSALGGYNWVSTTGINIIPGGLDLSGFTSGGTLTILSNSNVVHKVLGGFGGASDVFNIVLSKAGALAAGQVTIFDVETVNITTVDTQATPTHPMHTLTLSAPETTTLNITGNAGLTLIAPGYSPLTTVDASGITAGDFTYTTANLSAPMTIKGSATGTNTVDFSATTDLVTYTGGTGDDLVTGTNGQNNIVSLGAGDNSYTGGSGAETITLGGGDSTVDVGTGVDTVNVTGAAAASNTDFTTITGLGSGDFLKITAQGGAAEANGPLGVAVTVGGSPTLQDYLNAAAAGDGHTTAQVKWFQFGTDTYVVLDSHADAAFHAGVDIVVKLTGLTDLAPLSVTNGSIWL